MLHRSMCALTVRNEFLITGPSFSSLNKPDQERTGWSQPIVTAPGRNRLRDAYCVTFFGDWEEPSGESRFSHKRTFSAAQRMVRL